MAPELLKKKLPFTDKKVVQALLALLILVVVVLSLVGDKGWLERGKINEQERELKAEISALKKEKLEWYGKIASLKANRTYVETYSREQLGWIKKEEYLLLPPKEEMPRFEYLPEVGEAPPETTE